MTRRLQAVVVVAIVILLLFIVVVILFLGPKSNTPTHNAATSTTLKQSLPLDTRD